MAFRLYCSLSHHILWNEFAFYQDVQMEKDIQLNHTLDFDCKRPEYLHTFDFVANIKQVHVLIFNANPDEIHTKFANSFRELKSLWKNSMFLQSRLLNDEKSHIL